MNECKPLIRGNLTRSMESMGVDILIGNGKLMDAHTVSYGYPGKPGGKCTAGAYTRSHFSST